MPAAGKKKDHCKDTSKLNPNIEVRNTTQIPISKDPNSKRASERIPVEGSKVNFRKKPKPCENSIP
jgi:hypothetical protein